MRLILYVQNEHTHIKNKERPVLKKYGERLMAYKINLSPIGKNKVIWYWGIVIYPIVL